MDCLSCGKDLTNEKGAVAFMCPNCSGYEIRRCLHCRKVSAKYICPNCSFSGPN
ncbi:DUF1610 domain-containing protein [archaeon]|nr:DUF1610 domain-containing protein [archaeon]